MRSLRSSAWLYLLLPLLLLWPAGPPPAAAQPALADTWIAFTSLSPGYEGIWVIRPDGSDLRQLTEGRDLYPTWSPDGTLLAYVHEVSGTLLYGDIQGYGSEIRIVDTTGRIRYTIGRNEWVGGEPVSPLAGSVGLPQWSSDGQALSYGVNPDFFFLLGWGSRRTFYLSPPRIEVGRGPQGRLLVEGTVMLDQAWGPGPVPTWVQIDASLELCQVVAYDRLLFRTADEFLFNPRWSPDGASLTVYRQTLLGDAFYNALVQIDAAGNVERTLFESENLYLYTMAEPSPDGQRHLIGISADATSWFWQYLMSLSPEAGPVAVLPQEAPSTGYLYVLDQAGARTVVAQPQTGAVDLISRQPWSPDGTQVVFMRGPHPNAAGVAATGLGIYVGPPGQARRLVDFSLGEPAFEWTVAYPAWQPAPTGPLPTMVPLVPVSPEPTATPAMPEPTATPTVTPTPTPPPTTARPDPTLALTPTLTPTLTPAPDPGTAAPAAPPPNWRTPLLIGIGIVVLALVAAIAWTLLRPERPAGGGPRLRAPAFLTRLFKPRGAAGEVSSRKSSRLLLRRPALSEEQSRSADPLLRQPAPEDGAAAPKKWFALFARRPAGPAGEAATKRRFALWARRPASPAGEAAPPKRFALFTRRPASPAGEAAPKRRFALWARRPAPPEPAAAPEPAPDGPVGGEVPPGSAFPSPRPTPEQPADWLATDHRAESIGSEEPAARPPIGEPEERPAPTPRPARSDTTAETVSAPPPQAPAPEQALLRQGIAQVRAGRTAAGMVALQQVIQRAPDLGEAWLWLGWAAARQNQRTLAERCFVRAQELGWAEQATQALAWLRGAK